MGLKLDTYGALVVLLITAMTFDRALAGGPKDATYQCHEFSSKEGSLGRLLPSRPLLELKQHWLTSPDVDFAPGFVSAAWDKNFLYVYATLRDQDIFNPLEGFNLPFHQKGDIFEILIRSRDSDAYFEFQVTPQNHLLQLKFPHRSSLPDFKASGANLEQLVETFKVPNRIVQTHAHVDQANNTWTVFVKIPAEALSADAELRPYDRLQFSFCRYDYTRGKTDPVLSSTSDLSMCSFHRQEEWTTMTLLAH
jgi:hypothetical protein